MQKYVVSAKIQPGHPVGARATRLLSSSRNRQSGEFTSKALRRVSAAMGLCAAAAHHQSDITEEE